MLYPLFLKKINQGTLDYPVASISQWWAKCSWLGFCSVFPRAVATASPGNLLEMQVLRPHLLNQKLSWAQQAMINNPSRWFHCPSLLLFTNSSSLIWELVKHAKFQALPQTCCCAWESVFEHASQEICSSSHVQLFVTQWTVAHQAPLSLGFSRWGYWSGLPYLPLGDLTNAGIEPTSLMSSALAGSFFTASTTWEAPYSKAVFPVFLRTSLYLRKTQVLMPENWNFYQAARWDWCFWSMDHTSSSKCLERKQQVLQDSGKLGAKESRETSPDLLTNHRPPKIGQSKSVFIWF